MCLKHLLFSRRYAPLFWTQFLGAMNDNIFRNALILFVAYSSLGADPSQASLVNTLAGGLFIAPFFLFSSMAGQITDKFDKAHVIRATKVFELLVMGLTAAAFYHGHFPMLIALLFLMGSQSAFFGPAKYSIMGDHLSKAELMGGNAYIEAGTFLAILLGSILGSSLTILDPSMLTVGCALMGVSVLGWISSCFIPRTHTNQPTLKLGFNLIKETQELVKYTRSNPLIYWIIIGISWFWVIGFTFLTHLPVMTKEYLHGSEGCVLLIFLLFSVGIGVGSLLCHRLFKEQVSLDYLPYFGVLISLFLFDFFFSISSLPPLHSDAVLYAPWTFVSHPQHWRLIIDLLAMSVFSGLFVVPLYTTMQLVSPESTCSRIIAANNIFNAIFMVACSVLVSVFLAGRGQVMDVFLILAVVNVFMVVLVHQKTRPWQETWVLSS